MRSGPKILQMLPAPPGLWVAVWSPFDGGYSLHRVLSFGLLDDGRVVGLELRNVGGALELTRIDEAVVDFDCVEPEEEGLAKIAERALAEFLRVRRELQEAYDRVEQQRQPSASASSSTKRALS